MKLTEMLVRTLQGFSGPIRPWRNGKYNCIKVENFVYCFFSFWGCCLTQFYFTLHWRLQDISAWCVFGSVLTWRLRLRTSPSEPGVVLNSVYSLIDLSRKICSEQIQDGDSPFLCNQTKTELCTQTKVRSVFFLETLTSCLWRSSWHQSQQTDLSSRPSVSQFGWKTWFC